MSGSGLKFEKCVEFAVQGVQLPTIKTGALEGVVKAFDFNVKHTLGLILAPAVVSYVASDLQRVLDVGELRATGTMSGPPPLQTREILAQASRVQLEAFKHKASLPYEEQMQQISKAFGRGLVFIDIAVADPRGRIGFNAMLASLIIGSWTAFETMAADLWEAALNEHPTQLADLAGDTKAFRRGDKQENKTMEAPKQAQSSEKRRIVYLESLRANNYDVRKKMGTILRRKYNFSRLHDTRVAYGAAFGEGAKEVKRSVMDYSLDVLSAFRNVLVHSAGVIDEDYLERKLYLEDRIPFGEIGQRLYLDGASAVGLVKPALKAASSLIAAVDGWIAANQPPPWKEGHCNEGFIPPF